MWRMPHFQNLPALGIFCGSFSTVILKKQGNLPSDQFLAFVLVGKWMKTLSHTDKYKQVAWVSQCHFLTTEGEHLKNFYVQFPQSTFWLNHQLNSRLHLSSNHHCKWNIRYKETHRGRFFLFFCHIKIPSGHFHWRKLFSCCKYVLHSAMKDHSFRKQTFL